MWYRNNITAGRLAPELQNAWTAIFGLFLDLIWFGTNQLSTES